MTDPRKNSYENSNVDFDTPRSFAEFTRIQVAPKRPERDEGFRSMSTTEQQETVERLIDRIREL